MDALSTVADNDPGMTLYLNADGTAGTKRLEYMSVHEFGHVLGFEHEQDSDDNEGPFKCKVGVDAGTVGVPITPYDRDSIMNYCNRDGNATGNLTDSDITGVQKIYGLRRPTLRP